MAVEITKKNEYFPPTKKRTRKSVEQIAKRKGRSSESRYQNEMSGQEFNEIKNTSRQFDAPFVSVIISKYSRPCR